MPGLCEMCIVLVRWLAREKAVQQGNWMPFLMFIQQLHLILNKVTCCSNIYEEPQEFLINGSDSILIASLVRSFNTKTKSGAYLGGPGVKKNLY